MHVGGPAGHSEQQSGNTSQERRFARFVVAVDHVIVWLCRRKLDLAVDEVSETDEIDAIDSHRTSETDNRASSSASASSIAVFNVTGSNLIGSAPSASSVGNLFCRSTIASQLATLAGSWRSAATILTTSPIGSSRLSKVSRSKRGRVASCTRSTHNRPFPHSFAMLITSLRTCSGSRFSF